MARLCLSSSLLALLIHHLLISGVVSSATFTLVNKCNHTVWPGIYSDFSVKIPTTSFRLQKGETTTIIVPSSWIGRFYGRTQCAEDATGKFTCLTGDCGSGKLECSGSGTVPPATLAEFTLNGFGERDFFDVSLVNGYNLPMRVVPQGTQLNCSSTECRMDLNGACPSELTVVSSSGERVACLNPCWAFREDQYCCTGAYNSPSKCKPTSYSKVFKSVCPAAYSYAYDDRSSTFTCASTTILQ